MQLRQLYELYDSKEIQPYSIWLQRLKQESKWSAQDWLKARSYLYRLLSSGKTSKTQFTVVAIDLLILRLKDQVESKSIENIHLSIFNMIINDLEDMKEGGCKLILLDGQNRLEYPIKMFFQSDLSFYLTHKISGNPKSINFMIDGKQYTKESFLYNKISSEEKNLIDDIQVLFAIGREGQIDEFIEDLMDDNSGESWNEFEMMTTSLRTANYLVNGALSKDSTNSKQKNNVPEFKLVLDKIGKMDGAYHPEKKGYNKVLMELTQYDLNGNIKLDYQVILDEAKRDEISKSFYNVKEFFKALARDKQLYWAKKSRNVFPTKEHLRNLYTIVQILKGGGAGHKIPLDKIKSFKRIYEDYERFDAFKRDRIKNSSEYAQTGDKKATAALPNTWIWAQKDIKPEVLALRKLILTDFIKEHIEKWINQSSVFRRLDRSDLKPEIKTMVILNSKEDPYSVYGQELNQYSDDIVVDHFLQFERGKNGDGSNEVENLVAATSSSNQSRVK